MKGKAYIIAINYNGLSDTMAFIESMKQVNYLDYHIVIVDNASTRGDIGILEGIEGVTLLKSDENLGFSGGNNLGIQYAVEHHAEYIVIINNDTLVEPNFLTQAIVYLEKHPEVGVVTGKIMYEGDRNRFWFAGGRLSDMRGRAYHDGSNEEDVGQYDQVREISFCTGCLMVIPVETLKIVGLMRESYFLYFEDTEYCARFMENGYKIVYHPDVKIYHKVSASTGSGSALYHYYNWRNRLYFIAEHVPGLKKIPAYMFYTYEGVKRIVSKELPMKIYLRAIRDFLCGINGKVNL